MTDRVRQWMLGIIIVFGLIVTSAGYHMTGAEHWWLIHFTVWASVGLVTWLIVRGIE